MGNTGNSWHLLGVGKPTSFPENTDVLVEGISKGKREYLLYLPLYNGVSSVEIGIPKEIRKTKMDKHNRVKRNVIAFHLCKPGVNKFNFFNLFHNVTIILVYYSIFKSLLTVIGYMLYVIRYMVSGFKFQAVKSANDFTFKCYSFPKVIPSHWSVRKGLAGRPALL